MDRFELATMIRIALSAEPERLDAERSAALRDAGPLARELEADEVARARQMIEELERSGAMNRPPTRVS